MPDKVIFDFWLFIAGLGIFLFGMYHLENGLKGLAGRSFKKMLQRLTNKSWKGILTGASVTAVLQSSSLVTLLVVALLGSGMITLQNSLGVVFGANLGTTVTAWIVASLGFKINIAGFSYPFLAIGTLSYLMMDSRPVLKNMGGFLIGFGLLFLGLDYMKDAVEKVADQVNFTQYSHLGLFVFLLIGMVITALIQSSSAMIVIVLSALKAGLIDIHHSVAIVIGANIGTTSTLVIASIKGTADKKRLATANVSFNIVAGTVSFILLGQLVYFTEQYLRIKEPLMELVLINTLINLIGILLFYPFLVPFGNLIKTLFRHSEGKGKCMFITNAVPEVPDLAIRTIDQELKHIYTLTRDFVLDSLKINDESQEKPAIWNNIFKSDANPLQKYQHLKQMEDEITIFYKHIQEQRLTEAEAAMLSNHMAKLRLMISAAKHVKDVFQNIKDIDDSDDILAKEVLKQIQQFGHQRIQELEKFLQQNGVGKSLQDQHKDYEQFYIRTIEFLYNNLDTKREREIPVSSITNAIRKSILSLEDLSLSV